MKKIILLLVTIFLFTGCSKKEEKITCIYNYSNNSLVNIEMSIEGSFENNLLKNVKIKYNYALIDGSNNSMSIIESIAQNSTKNYRNLNHVKIEEEKKDTEYIVTYNLKFSKMDDDEKQLFEMKSKYTRQEFKDSYQNLNFNCK